MHILVSCLQVFMFENINQLSSERIEMLCALELIVEITIHKSACVCVCARMCCKQGSRHAEITLERQKTTAVCWQECLNVVMCACACLWVPLIKVEDEEGDDNRGRRSWMFRLDWPGHLARLCSGPSLSPNPECVWFFSYMINTGFLCWLFFGSSPLQLLMALVWAGLVWFLWFGSRLLLSLSALIGKLWQEDRRYWLSWQCGRLMRFHSLKQDCVSRLLLLQRLR